MKIVKNERDPPLFTSKQLINMIFLTTMLTTADVNIHTLIAKYGIDIQIVRPEMTKFKMFRVKVNMDFYFVGITF